MAWGQTFPIKALQDLALSALGPAANKVIGNCRPGATVKLANNRCANGWNAPGYQSWGKEADDDEPGQFLPDDAPAIIVGKGRTLQILDVRAEIRMVQVQDGARKLWVNADSLTCDQRNVSNYTPPLAPPIDSCAFSSLPFEPKDMFEMVEDSQKELGNTILAKAQGYAREMRLKVMQDTSRLASAYQTLGSDAKRAEILENGFKKVADLYYRARRIYGDDCRKNVQGDGGIYEIPRERGQRTCRTMRYGFNVMGDIEEHAKSEMDLIGPFEKRLQQALLNIKTTINPFEGGDLSELFSESDPSNNQVFVRMMIYYGLGLDAPEYKLSKAQQKLKKSLHLVNRDAGDFTYLEHALHLKPGKPFDEIHNGYLYGASGQPGDPIECAGFALNYVLGMKRVADPGGKGSIPTVWDFENIHRFLSSEAGQPPYFSEYSGCFNVVDLRKDQVIQPGDFVASHGHVVIVQQYDYRKREIKTIEAASGKCGSVCEDRSRPLFEPSCSASDPNGKFQWNTRPMRSDIRVLRYDPSGEACRRLGKGVCPPCPIKLYPLKK